MSVNAKEHFWTEHQDTLRRIRSQLVSGKKSPIKSRTPVYGKRSPNLKASHPPYGRYRRSTPPSLPRLHTPPEHEERRSYRNLRKSRYEEVPPLRPKKAFERMPEYDSWGEATDEDKEDNLKPHPLPYPIYAPPSVVYGQPFPMYYPPPPKGSLRHRKRKKKKRKDDGGFLDVASEHESMSGKKKGKKSRYNKMPTHAYPGPVNGYPVPMLNAYVMPMPTRSPDDSASEDEDDDGPEKKPLYYTPPQATPPRRRYQVSNALLQPEKTFNEVHTFFNKHPLFADDFVNWFIMDCLGEDIVPDVLIDAFTELDKLPAEHPYLMPALKVCDEFLTDEIEGMLREIILDSMTDVAIDMKHQYIETAMPYVPPRDPLDIFLDDLVEDTVTDLCREIVRGTVLGLAHDYLEDVQAEGILNDLIADEVHDIRHDLLDAVVFEVIADDFLEEHVLGPEIEDEAAVIAQDMIKHYDNKITKREMKAVKEKSGERLVDSLCLDYLLALVARQGKVWTESDFANRLLDEMLGNMLLQQYFGVKTNREKTIQCKPLRKLHEKVVTDVALDVLLQQLSSSLDEDLADVDEYERGVNDEVSLPPAPAIVR